MEQLAGTGPAAVSSVVEVGEVRDSPLHRISLLVTGSPVGSMDILAAMGHVVLSSDVRVCDSVPRLTSFAVSASVFGWVDPPVGMGPATSVGSDVAKGDIPDSAPCPTSFAAIASVAGEGEGRPLVLIFFPVLLIRLRSSLKKKRFGCCGVDIGSSLRDEGFRERRVYVTWHHQEA